MGLSEWVLSRIISAPHEEFQRCLERLKNQDSPKFVLAEIHDLLGQASPGEFERMTAQPPGVVLPDYLANYVAAMVEYAAVQKGRGVPAWTRQIPPLAAPVFGTDLNSLRLYLLTHSPPPFRRRNIFIDATIGQRV